MTGRTRNISSSTEEKYFGTTYIAETPAKRLRERLSEPEAFLSRTDLRELGLERRAVDAVFRACPVLELPGYARPLIRVEDFRRLLADSTYGPGRVRPCGPSR